MKPATTIRLLTTTNNEKGDLFTQLMDDLFAALGYEKLRHDIAKPGREVDVHGNHYIERRQMRAECKAHQRKMGGDDVGKFRGALVAEQIEAGKQKIEGYFVSLGGFTESAILQEERLGRKGVILIDSPQIIKYLELGKRIVPDAVAVDQASRCIPQTDLASLVADSVELLGHESGYIKAVYYARNSQLTHVALISAANGWPLAEVAVHEIIKADTAAGGGLADLRYLAPSTHILDKQKEEEAALAFYRACIGRECGFIQLDGLPLDGKLDKKLALERLFVPLKVSVFKKQTEFKPAVRASSSPPPKYASNYVPNPDKPLDVGQALGAARHLALLATPGSGKSTLLKRLATAYAFTERRTEVDDKLPAQPWLPIFLRCRNLREHTAKSVMQLLTEVLPQQLSMTPSVTAGFIGIVHRELAEGNLLLLVDGLDEIWNEAGRLELAHNIQAFVEAYPTVKLVVTSREAGFRVIAGVMAETCYQARILPLDNAGISYLCQQWHAEVYGEAESVRLEAERLVNEILANRNVWSLAQNPLLLTTLLVVKRSIGELPTNRVALYAAAVQLLVKTWNIEGFNALNERETFAQLCYVACAMTEIDAKRVSHGTLIRWLEEARQILAAELQYTKLSPEEFILQVEHRSSLLMMVGHDIVHGELQPIYEFRHLTFQEYLAARGYVRNLHARRAERLSLLDVLLPHIDDDSWQEVIRLAAVLAEVDAEPLVEHLNLLCELVDSEDLDCTDKAAEVLANLLRDEVTVHPMILRASLKQLARFSRDEWMERTVLLEFEQGRLGPALLAAVEEEYLSGKHNWEEYTHAMGLLCSPEKERALFGPVESNGLRPVQEKYVAHLLHTGTRAEQVKAAFEFSSEVHFWDVLHDRQQVMPTTLGWLPETVRTQLLELFRRLVASSDPPSVYAGAWALVCGFEGVQALQQQDSDPHLVEALIQAWCATKSMTMERVLARALVNQSVLPRDTFQEAGFDKEAIGALLTEWLKYFYSGEVSPTELKAILLIAWYLRTPWPDFTLLHLLTEAYEMSGRLISGMIDPWQVKQLRNIAYLLSNTEIEKPEDAEWVTAMIGEFKRLLTQEGGTPPASFMHAISSAEARMPFVDNDLPF